MTVSSTNSSSSSSTSAYGNLSQTWVSLIQTQMTSEKQIRLNRLSQQSSDLDLRSAVFTDLSSQISNLKGTLGSLWSSNGSYVLNGQQSVSVSNPSISGTTVLTATADSSATLGTYNIAVDHLATQHRVASTANLSSSSTALGYTGGFSITLGAKTTQFSVDTSDTLYSIASKINSATYDSGKGVSASVVNNVLTLESVSSGKDNKMTLADSASGGPLESLGIIDNKNNILTASQLQDGVDAQFTVNGVSVDRSSNSGLTDVISGVTLNLAADAKGNSAIMTVQTNSTAVSSALQNFITNYNALQTYLGNKIGFTKVDDTHYTAGALANELSVRSLKTDLSDQVSFSAGSGAVKFFADLGISINNNQLSITDTTKLNDALKNNLSDVKTFLDTKMSKIDTLLGNYVGTSNSFVTYSIQNMADQKTQITNSITDENKRLDARQQALVSYYQTVQAEIDAMSNTQSELSSYIYSSMYPTATQ